MENKVSTENHMPYQNQALKFNEKKIKRYQHCNDSC